MESVLQELINENKRLAVESALKDVQKEPPIVYKQKALAISRLAVEGVGKDSKNDFHKYKYRSIDGLYNAVAPILGECGLSVAVRVVKIHQEECKSAKGAPETYTQVAVEYTISAEDGSSTVSVLYGECIDGGDKGINKAMSAAYKYFLVQNFCIPTEGDNDADAHSPVRAPAEKPKDPNGPWIPKEPSQVAAPQQSVDTVSTNVSKVTDQVSEIFKGSKLVEGGGKMLPEQKAKIGQIFKERKIPLKDVTILCRNVCDKDPPSDAVQWTFEDAAKLLAHLETPQ